MNLPFFYNALINPGDKIVLLEEDSSKHIVQVLRMQKGEKLNLTDGKGNIFTCAVVDDHRKKCSVEILETQSVATPEKKICIAISPLKNNSRFEWFLEKATEIGVSQIVPIICERTEKQQVKTERLQTILVSAVLQSQQAWLPALREPIRFSHFIKENLAGNKLIAHCDDQHKEPLSTSQSRNASTILIGPEGDFSLKEIEEALRQGFKPVTLGTTRLRTETAGVVAAAILCNA